MNSSLVCIGILVKSNISKQCLINFLNQVSRSALRKHLGAAEVYDGNAKKKKSDLIDLLYLNNYHVTIIITIKSIY